MVRLGRCFALFALAALGFACGSGVSADEAKTFCDQEKAAIGNDFGSKSYDTCISCYEQCGQKCVRQAASPVTYQCQ